MHDIRVLSSGDMCMTLSGHTSTLPRLVVQGRVFEGSLLQSGFGGKKCPNRHLYDRGRDLVYYYTRRRVITGEVYGAKYKGPADVN